MAFLSLSDVKKEYHTGSVTVLYRQRGRKSR